MWGKEEHLLEVFVLDELGVKWIFWQIVTIFLFSNGDFAATLKSRTLGLAGKLYAWHRKSNKKLAVKPTLQQCNVASLDVKIKEMLIIQHKLRKQACESSEDAVAR